MPRPTSPAKWSPSKNKKNHSKIWELSNCSPNDGIYFTIFCRTLPRFHHLNRLLNVFMTSLFSAWLSLPPITHVTRNCYYRPTNDTRCLCQQPFNVTKYQCHQRFYVTKCLSPKKYHRMSGYLTRCGGGEESVDKNVYIVQKRLTRSFPV